MPAAPRTPACDAAVPVGLVVSRGGVAKPFVHQARNSPRTQNRSWTDSIGQVRQSIRGENPVRCPLARSPRLPRGAANDRDRRDSRLPGDPRSPALRERARVRAVWPIGPIAASPAAAARAQPVPRPAMPRTPGRVCPTSPPCGESTDWYHGSWACPINSLGLRKKPPPQNDSSSSSR